MTPATALQDRAVARHEALLLLAHASARTREALLASPDRALPAAQAEVYRTLRDRRVAGEPIAYLLGWREFYGRRFAVDPDVLIPRPETELLIDLAIARCTTAKPAILDLGTGSGVIAVTLALEVHGARVIGTDASTHALDVARDNATSLAATVAWRAGDWYHALAGTDPPFDLVVSNPPYIADGDRHLGEGDLRFEPASALSDGHDGLSALRGIVHGAPSRLVPGGTLIVEHGHDQAAAVRGLFAGAGFIAVESMRDLAGIERATTGRVA